MKEEHDKTSPGCYVSQAIEQQLHAPSFIHKFMWKPLISVHFPLEVREGKGNTEEEQHTEDWACMATVEKKMQFYFCKVSKTQQDPGWGSERHGLNFTDITESWGNFSLLVELLSSLPRKQCMQTHSLLLPGCNSTPS